MEGKADRILKKERKKVFAVSSQRQRFSQKHAEGAEAVQTTTRRSQQNDVEGEADQTVFVWRL